MTVISPEAQPRQAQVHVLDAELHWFACESIRKRVRLVALPMKAGGGRDAQLQRRTVGSDSSVFAGTGTDGPETGHRLETPACRSAGTLPWNTPANWPTMPPRPAPI